MGKLEKLAMQALRADMNLKEAKRIADEAKEQFIKALEAANMWNTDTKAVGNVRTKIQNNRFFDVTTAEKLAGDEAVEKAQVTATDAKILKSMMSDNDIEAAMKPYKNPYKLSLEVLRD